MQTHDCNGKDMSRPRPTKEHLVESKNAFAVCNRLFSKTLKSNDFWERVRDGEREWKRERERDKETATRERKICITCLCVLGSLRGFAGPDDL